MERTRFLIIDIMNAIKTKKKKSFSFHRNRWLMVKIIQGKLCHMKKVKENRWVKEQKQNYCFHKSIMSHIIMCVVMICTMFYESCFVILSLSPRNYHILIIGSAKRGRNKSQFKNRKWIYGFYLLLNQQHDRNFIL